jgi:hypothetical protein
MIYPGLAGFRKVGPAVRCRRDSGASGVPFDEGRTQPWKEGWISADINVGLAGIED